jgi:hypothetical protein
MGTGQEYVVPAGMIVPGGVLTRFIVKVPPVQIIAV